MAEIDPLKPVAPTRPSRRIEPGEQRESPARRNPDKPAKRGPDEHDPDAPQIDEYA